MRQSLSSGETDPRNQQVRMQKWCKNCGEEIEDLTGVVMASSVSWAITPSSPLKVTIGGTCRLCLLFCAGFSRSLYFDPEEGGDVFLRNVSLLPTDCMALYLRR
jgi:hypothetical protein